MMGLGYKRANQELAHPKDLHGLRRSDENLSDLIVLGAILSFGFGTVTWLLLGETPRFLGHFSERAEYLGFFWGVVIQLFILLFLYWLLDTAVLWPRFAMFFVSLMFGLSVGVRGLMKLEEIWQQTAYLLLAIYSFSVAVTALYQFIKILPGTRGETIGSKFDREQ